jgi:hypothetical protein
MVRLEGRKGLFLVKRVNRHNGVADLMRRSGQRELFEMSVPFRLIQTVPQEASKAIREFLRSDSAAGGTAVA